MKRRALRIIVCRNLAVGMLLPDVVEVLTRKTAATKTEDTKKEAKVMGLLQLH